MPASRPPARPEPAHQPPMRALLASCAAARAISTPPPPPAGHTPAHREAA
ncbi:hypothetical protein [Streptomyces sp. NPDC001781]